MTHHTPGWINRNPPFAVVTHNQGPTVGLPESLTAYSELKQSNQQEHNVRDGWNYDLIRNFRKESVLQDDWQIDRIKLLNAGTVKNFHQEAADGIIHSDDSVLLSMSTV